MPNVSREVEKRAKCPLFIGAEVHSAAVFLCRAVGLASVAPGVRWPPCARGGYDPPVRGVGGCGSLPPLRCVGAAGCLVLAAICPPSKVAAVSSLPSACVWLRFVRSLVVCRGRPPLFLKIRCGCRRRSEAPPCKLVKQIKNGGFKAVMVQQALHFVYIACTAI